MSRTPQRRKKPDVRCNAALGVLTDLADMLKEIADQAEASPPDGRPNQWRILARLDGATADAIEFAVARGWLLIGSGHRVCLTEAREAAGNGAEVTIQSPLRL